MATGTQTGMLFSLATDEMNAALAAIAVYVPSVSKRIRAARRAGQADRVTQLSAEFAAADRLAQRLQEGDGVPIKGCLACYSPRCTKCRRCHECDDPEFTCAAKGGVAEGEALTAGEAVLVAQFALVDRVADVELLYDILRFARDEFRDENGPPLSNEENDRVQAWVDQLEKLLPVNAEGR